MSDTDVRPLSDAQIQQFVDHGYVRLDGAFDGRAAAHARDVLARDGGFDPADPTTWRRPAIRLGMYPQPAIAATADTPRLRGAFDQLVGPGRWLPCRSVGTFRIAFPSTDDPGDLGWHVDVSFGLQVPDFMDWRCNVRSKGRALLLLMLFSDVGPDDAPTRMRAGSHLDIARQLAPAGEAGLTLRTLAAHGFAETAHRPEHHAVGAAGTVYLCHPFLVHAAQPHRGTRPRYLAQPPLLPTGDFDPASDSSPVERAIRLALSVD